jgi:Uma2 family endonuclease
MSTLTSPVTKTAQFSLDHYERMVELGAFAPPYDIHVELMRGVIVEKGVGRPAKFSLEHYEHMVRVGAFDPPFNIRAELIQGEILMMSPIGPPHHHFLQVLTDWSYEVAPRDQIAVHVQSPIRISTTGSEPQPDLVWTPRRDFSRQHPNPEDVLLLVEVAESSLNYDRAIKLPTYALAGIVDYWIVNLIDEQIEVYRKPSGRSYQDKSIYRGDAEIHPLALPTATLKPSQLFGA